MTAVDIVLLEHEWNLVTCLGCGTSPGMTCLDCTGPFPQHATGCRVDQALSERGWQTREQREAARERLRAATDVTLPPPGDSGDSAS